MESNTRKGFLFCACATVIAVGSNGEVYLSRRELLSANINVEPTMGSWSNGGTPLLEGIPERDETLGSEGESLLSSPRSEPIDLDPDLTDSLLDRDSVLDDENASSISIPDTESSMHDSEDSVLGSPSFNRDFTNLDHLNSHTNPSRKNCLLRIRPGYVESQYDFTKPRPPDIALPTSIPPTLNAILRQHNKSKLTEGLSSELSAMGFTSTRVDAANLNEPLQLQVPSPLDAVLDMTRQVIVLVRNPQSPLHTTPLSVSANLSSGFQVEALALKALQWKKRPRP